MSTLRPPSAPVSAGGEEKPGPENAHSRAFFQQGATGVAELDAGGRFLAVNPKLCEITGHTREELLGLRLDDLLDAGPAPAKPDGSRDFSLKETFPAGEARLRKKTGGTARVRLDASPLEKDPATGAATLVVALDLSALEAAETATRSISERYQALFSSIDAGFCVIEMLFDAENSGTDYLFLETNAAFVRMTGLANVLGLRVRQLVPQHEQHWFDTYGRVALTGEPARFEQEARALDRWYGVYAFKIGDAPSRKVAVLFDDITARKRSEQRRLFLADLTEKVACLRDESAIVHATVHALGRFLDADRCFFARCVEPEARLVISENYTRDGGPGLAGSLDLAPLGGLAAWENGSRGDIAVEDVVNDPFAGAQADAYAAAGLRAWLAQPFREDGRTSRLLVVTANTPRRWTPEEIKLVDDVVARVWPVVERANNERALRAAHEALEQRVAERTVRLQDAVSELEAYSYSISHDLRAPLRAMQTFAHILMDDCAGQLDAEARGYLGRIVSSTERMDRLISDVLVLSRSARAEMPLESIELGAFITGIIQSYPGLDADSAEIELIAPLAFARANPAALTQCVSNLLGNAIKFVPTGTVPRIRIWTRVESRRVRLFIRDNGIGIAPEIQKKIFGIFYQGNTGLEGTGIGLAIVNKAIERMGGQVGVESRPGAGSTFWLELELATSS